MPKLVVFSDVHIRSNEETLYKDFCACLAALSMAKGDTLVLLGDIFDLFLGRNFFAENYREFFQILEDFSEKGCSIYYVEGNHDFSMKNLTRNPEYSHIKIIEDSEFVLEVRGKKTFFTHGDLVNPKDYGYRFLRALFRSFPLQVFIKFAPVSWIRTIGLRASEKSRVFTEPDQGQINQIKVLYRNFACEKIENGFDYVISGHNHLKDEFDIVIGKRSGKYMNPGFFPKDKTYIIFSEKTGAPEFHHLG